MPVKTTKTQTMPAQAEVVCDNILLRNLNLFYNDAQDSFSVEARISFYAEKNGKKIFHKDEQGNITSKIIAIPNLYAEAGINPKLAKAVVAILDACVDKYEKIVEPSVEAPPTPPAPSPEAVKKK